MKMKGMSCGLKHHRQPLAARSRHRQVQTEQLHENTKVQCDGKQLGEGKQLGGGVGGGAGGNLCK